ncbi:hypothetical protein FQZ97_681750 [compost metagenome]
MQVRGAAANGIQQHLVDEAHHWSVVGVHPSWAVILVVIDSLNVHSIQIDVAEFFHAAVGGLEKLIYCIAEFIVLDQDGFGVQAGAELDVGYSLVVGRVGNAHEQLVASAPEGQGTMLAHQLFAYQIPWLGFLVNAG